MQRDFVYMESTQPQVRFGYHPEIAVVGGGLKLFDTPSPHFYNLKNDVLEEQNIISTAEVPKKFEGKAKETFLRTSEVESQSSINNQVVDQLAALGYISNDFDQSEISNIDAKDKIATISKLNSFENYKRRVWKQKRTEIKLKQK